MGDETVVAIKIFVVQPDDDGILEIDLAGLENRLNDIDVRGVVYAPDQSLADLYAQRLPLYRKTADITVKASRVTPDQLVLRIIDRLKNAGPIRGEMELV